MNRQDFRMLMRGLDDALTFARGDARPRARARLVVIKDAKRAQEIEDERHRQTLAALADVDAGRVVSHRIVREWAAKIRAKAASRKRKTTSG